MEVRLGRLDRAICRFAHRPNGDIDADEVDCRPTSWPPIGRLLGPTQTDRERLRGFHLERQVARVHDSDAPDADPRSHGQVRHHLYDPADGDSHVTGPSGDAHRCYLERT